MGDFLKNRRVGYAVALIAGLMVISLAWLSIVGASILPITTSDPGKQVPRQEKAAVQPPEFSIEGGFYDSPLSLELHAPEGTKIYYTLDCTDPTEASEQYTKTLSLDNATPHENVYSMRTDVSAGFYSDLIEEHQTVDPDPNYLLPDFPVEKCSVVRAVAVNESGERSDIVTKCYFVGMKPSDFGAVRFVSVTTDPSNLFDADKGIYVTGSIFDAYIHSDSLNPNWRFWNANYRQHGREWERTAHIAFYDEQGQLISETPTGGLRVQGGVSRGALPRSLNLYARTSRGEDALFDAPLFETDYLAQTLTLAGGGNNVLTKVNDYMMTDRCRHLNFATMSFEPYVLFLDGEYWGFYWLADKFDENYLAYRYGVDPDNVLIVKHDLLDKGDESNMVLYNKMKYDITYGDMSLPEDYQHACNLIDIDSFIDYYATMAYIARQEDWPKTNFALWRAVEPQPDVYSDGKWRWILFDCNSLAMRAELVKDDSLSFIIENDALFAALWKNADFQKQFQTRIIEIADECFNAESMEQYFDEYDQNMRAILQKSWTRFHGQDNDKLTDYCEEMESYRTFFRERKAVVLSWFE